MSASRSSLKRPRNTSSETPVSSPAQPKTRKNTRQDLIWGEQKEDFKPVKISIEISSIINTNLLQQFREVSYTDYKTGEQITAPVHQGKRSLMVEESLKTDLCHKLGPLIQNLKPLENLTTCFDKHGIPRWQWMTDTPHMDDLCSEIYVALKLNMVDTEGKHAMRELLNEIIIRLNMKGTLVALSTGSVKASRCACLVEVNIISNPSPTSSTSSEEQTQEYVNYNVPSTIEKTSLTLRCAQKDSPQPTGPGSSPTDEQSPHQKYRISDILVCSKKSLYEPIVSHLVVSIKSGPRVNPTDIVQEIMARLPYQSGIIYGLEINHLQANLYSVEKLDPDSGPFVGLFSYPEYSFQKEFDFDLPTFQKMVLDIGSILKMVKS